MRTLKRLILLAFVTAALSACGGGGGGGDDSSGPDSDNRAAITTQNAETVASTVLTSVVAVFDFGILIETSPISAGKQTRHALAKLVATRAGVSRAVIGPETIPCTVSGSVTISGDIADPSTLSAGDDIRADFNDCDDGDGVVIDGLFDATVVSFTGDLDLVVARLTMAVDAGDLAITTDGDTASVDGDYTFTIDTLTSPIVSLEVSCESLSITSFGTTVMLEEFSAIQTQNATAIPRPITAETDGRLTTSAIGGPVDFSTPLRFDAFDDDYPYAGELLIVGRNESSVRLIALNETNVRLDVDADGNGAVDQSIDLLWNDVWAR